MNRSRRKTMIIGAAASIGVAFLALLLFIRSTSRPTETPEQFEIQKTLNEEALRAGETQRIIPTLPPGSQTEGSNAIRRIETGTGQTVVFGEITGLQGNIVSVNYVEGEEDFVLVPGSTVFSLSQSGSHDRSSQDGLRSLSFPQIASVSFDTATKEIISVTIYQTK